MSVTIHSSPQAYTPSDNPIVWTFSSNQTAQPNFSYIVEVYVNAVLDARHEVLPEVGARAHFDVSETMRKVTPTATLPHTTVVRSADNTASCYITVRERYGTTPAYGASATSGTVIAYKARLTNEQMEAYTASTYVVLNANRKFMTFNTNDLSIPFDKDYFLSMITNGESDLTLVFKLFNADGTQIVSADISISDSWNISQFNLRPSLFVSDLSGLIPLSTFQSAAYMEVFIEYSGGTEYSETKRLYFDHSTCKQLAHCVWLNRLGSWDVYNFGHNTIESANVASMTYEKQFGGWEGTQYKLNSQNSGELDYMKTTRNRLQLVSEYITGPVQNYLVTSMYNSPLCYISGATYRRVKIESTAYELQNDDFEEEFTEIVDLSLPNTDHSVSL